MNILVANWTWYPSGGDWTYVENLCKFYEQNGHKIIPFSMKDERNYATEYSKYFIEKIDYKGLNKNRTIFNGIKVLTKSIYSYEAKHKIKWLIKENHIDLVHLNNIHHYITPSILSEIKKNNIPVIWTLHDYTILCPENSFVNNGVICEKCKGGHFFHCAFDRCKKNSYLPSSVAALENYIHKLIKIYSYVDYFICPSIFLFNKFKDFGFYADKLIQIYNCYEFSVTEYEKRNNVFSNDERYIVFVGRLEKIKGVNTLLNAMKLIPDIKLKIIGNGTQENALKAYKDECNLQNVEFLGKRKKEEVLSLIGKSDFLICPSEWFEVMGFVNIEAMLLGKPVIGSRIGAIPEIVIDGVTGLLFEPGNHNELSEKIKTLYYDTKMLEKLGQNAMSKIKNVVSYENHFKELKKIVPTL
jgi:glycosyltransferase involved in cell wall biosynthesis